MRYERTEESVPNVVSLVHVLVGMRNGKNKLRDDEIDLFFSVLKQKY